MNKVEVIQKLKQYIEENNLKAPKNTADYDSIVKNLKGFSRAWLCKNGIICTVDIIPFLSSDYTNNETIRYNKYSQQAEKLGLNMRKENPAEIIGRKTNVVISCNKCYYEETITVHSLMRRIYGCKRCSKQSKWESREQEFLDICKIKNIRLDSTLKFSNIEKNNNSRISIVCNKCDTIFERTFANIIGLRYPTNCPKCHPPKVFGNMGNSVYFDEIEFDSNFEVDAYKILLKYLRKSDIKVHVPYTSIVDNINYTYIADFVLKDSIVLEVSSFILYNHEKYADRLNKKKELVESTNKYKFVFCNTLAEVEYFIKTII